MLYEVITGHVVDIAQHLDGAAAHQIIDLVDDDRPRELGQHLDHVVDDESYNFV